MLRAPVLEGLALGTNQTRWAAWFDLNGCAVLGKWFLDPAAEEKLSVSCRNLPLALQTPSPRRSSGSRMCTSFLIIISWLSFLLRLCSSSVVPRSEDAVIRLCWGMSGLRADSSPYDDPACSFIVVRAPYDRKRIGSGVWLLRRSSMAPMPMEKLKTLMKLLMFGMVADMSDHVSMACWQSSGFVTANSGSGDWV